MRRRKMAERGDEVSRQEVRGIVPKGPEEEEEDHTSANAPAYRRAPIQRSGTYAPVPDFRRYSPTAKDVQQITSELEQRSCLCCVCHRRQIHEQAEFPRFWDRAFLFEDARNKMGWDA